MILAQANVNFRATPVAARPSVAQNFQPTNLEDEFQSQQHMGEAHVGKALLKGAIYAGAGALLGAGMSQGGVAGSVCGILAGATVGAVTIAPMGNGKGADGLLYAAAGLVGGGLAGAVAGAFGVPHAALALGVGLGGIQTIRTLTAKD